MKRFIVVFLIFGMGNLQAQFNEFSGTLKAGIGYTHDFPGLNGYTISGEYAFPLNEQFGGSMGMKYANLNGYPRTKLANEFTKAATLDFNFYWAPFRSDMQSFRIGLGYSFSFYNIKRAYPVFVEGAGGKTITWPSTQSKGRTSGINLVAEYEYKIPDSDLSIGLRGAFYKAYDRTFFIGPILGIQL